MPNRVHLRCGLIVHLRLLSTPPRGDAVTFGYGVPEHPGGDFHPADSMRSQAHPLAAAPPGQASCPGHPRFDKGFRKPGGPVKLRLTARVDEVSGRGCAATPATLPRFPPP